MADNVTITAGTGTTIASDDVGGVQFQRVKITTGADGTATDVTSTTPVPVWGPDASVSGTITATDAVLGVHLNDGTVKTGTPTANSYVALALGGGESGYSVRLSGTFGAGTVWIEVSPDSTNGIDGGWITALTRQSGTSSSTLDESITSAGIFRGNGTAMTYVRFRITGATAPSVTIAARASDATGAVFLNAAIPSGTNTIGSVMTAAPDATATGTISATDAVLGTHAGAGVLLSGTPTANSYVALAVPGGEGSYIVQLTGTFGSGTVWFETSADSTTGINGNWSTLSLRVMGTTGSTISDAATIAGLYRGNLSGMAYIRVRMTGGTAPSVAVVLRASDAGGPTALNAAIPSGSNNIGVVGPAPSATGTITGPALSLTSFTLLASNTARKTATFYNESPNLVYLAMATTASTTSYTVQLPSGGYYELPGTNAVFTGLVTGIALVASGNVRVTELT